jgi:hypothetical protein
MAILGINATWGYSSACSISSALSISALCEKHSRAFPISAINKMRIAHDTWDSYVTHQHAANAVRQAMPQGMRLEIVDYCEALSMATISSTNWSSCAILLIDSYYTRLGYYVDGSFYWIREFAYPNSLALFSAAATRFLGFDAAEDSARNLALRGKAVFVPWLLRNVITLGDGSYQLLHNLERGVGTAVPLADAAASAQSVFSTIATNLAQWLRRNIDIPRLAIVGIGAANYISNSAIADNTDYDSVAAISINGAAATALGAAALLRRPIYEHHNVGINTSISISAEKLAARLLQGDRVSYTGIEEFSDNNFLSNSSLSLAFDTYLNEPNYPITYAICQDIDYNKYFTSRYKPYFGQYLSEVSNKKAINCDYARVLTVAKNKNPFINRVLELTRTQGYPIILSRPLA